MRAELLGAYRPKLPTALDDIRTLLRSLDWQHLREEVQQEAETRLAIVGPVNSGKSTLFNLLEGRNISAASPIPGTTKSVVREEMGPFTLLDTPGFGEVGGQDRAAIAIRGAAEADALIVVFDAAAGLRQSDAQLLDSLKGLGKPLVVVANKIDLVGGDAGKVEADMSARLGLPVIGISAKKGTNVGERLLPAVVDALPQLAVLLGRHLPAFRRTAANKVVRNSMLINAGIGTEPIPFIDIPVLLTTQARMVLRIAAIYGEPFTARHARELMATVAGGLGLRMLGQEAAKLVPVAGWAVAGGVAAVGTWAMGQVAIQYFESGKQLGRRELQDTYKNMLKDPKAHFEALTEDQTPPLNVPSEPYSAKPAVELPTDDSQRRGMQWPFGKKRDE